MDSAFVMNEKDNQTNSYRGILSVKSCNIQNFSFGFFIGTNSILSIELSYVTDCRQTAIYTINPKILKVSGTVFENIEGNGIEIKFSNDTEPSPNKKNETVVKKIFIEENRIQNCKDNGIKLTSKGSKHKNITQTNAIVKLLKNRLYNNYQYGIYA